MVLQNTCDTLSSSDAEVNRMDKRKTLLLGAHMSISGGLDKALIRGHELGCNTIQMLPETQTGGRGVHLRNHR